jgi:3-hydroxyacyl-CoA dehydrogenase/enoyl-CoA hydratase/3-hydroxybutyryl-CoA epimerase
MSAAHLMSLERADESMVSVDVRKDGVALVVIDGARGEYSTLTASFAAQLAAAVDRIEQDASIAAAVLTQGSPDGVARVTDVELLKSIKFATDAERLARDAGRLLRSIDQLKKPIVAAAHGPVLGGRLELYLACHAFVASDEQTIVGFPEVRVGLIPAANGVLRVAQRAGLRAAIDLAIGGNSLTAAQARVLRLVDEVCPLPILLDVAARCARALVGHLPRTRHKGFDAAALVFEKNLVARGLLFRNARDGLRARGRDCHGSGRRVLDVLERYASKGFDAAAELEAKLFGELVVSENAHRLIELHCATVALEDDPAVEERVEAREVARVNVIGGGSMGSGIAYVTVIAGASVRIKEKDDAAAGRALKAVGTLLDTNVRERRWTPLERDRVLSRLSATIDHSGIRHADLVVEAVFEDLELKKAVLHDVESLVAPTCVIASSTSSIPISKIAQGANVPGRVLGMHYFNPVPKMPLLEVVRAEKTEAWAVATAVAMGKRQMKTVIVVKDTPGFFTTRILAPLIGEATQLLGEGVPVEAVDHAMVDWGFPLGPLRLLDEIGIDVSAHVAHLLYSAFGERMTPPRPLAKLADDDRRGRKNLRGLYCYSGRAAHAREDHSPDPSVYALLDVRPPTLLPVEEIQMRCALAMINEAIRCFGEGIIRCARDGDVGAVLGLGFPRFRGGPFRYVDTIGAADALRRVQGYADRFGERWRPAPLLVHMAKKGERFYA